MKIAVETTFNNKDERIKKLVVLVNPFNMSEIDTMLATITQIQHRLVDLKNAYEKKYHYNPETDPIVG